MGPSVAWSCEIDRTPELRQVIHGAWVPFGVHEGYLLTPNHPCWKIYLIRNVQLEVVKAMYCVSL